MAPPLAAEAQAAVDRDFLRRDDASRSVADQRMVGAILAGCNLGCGSTRSRPGTGDVKPKRIRPVFREVAAGRHHPRSVSVGRPLQTASPMGGSGPRTAAPRPPLPQRRIMTFFPCRTPPHATGRVGTPRSRHSSRGKKVPLAPSSAALRSQSSPHRASAMGAPRRCGVGRLRPSDRHRGRMVRARKLCFGMED